jgi:hypothetical protein
LQNLPIFLLILWISFQTILLLTPYP